MKNATWMLGAVAALAGMIGGCGANPAAHRINGDQAFAAHKWDAAAVEYEKYLEYKPGEDEIRANTATAYMKQEKWTEAAEHLRLIHTQSPGTVKYTEMLAEALYKSKQNDELFRLLRSEAMESQSAADWMRLGDYAIKLGDKDTAQTALLSAAKVDGGRTWKPHVALYDYYRSMGQKGEAIERLRMAAWVAPNEPEVHRRMAESGAITGPTFPVRPIEWREPPAAPVTATAEEPKK